jgi:hypothetical protein
MATKLERELAAQKKRVEALKYLSEHGCSGTDLKNILSRGKIEFKEKVSTDNTLDLLFKQTAAQTARKNELELQNKLINFQRNKISADNSSITESSSSSQSLASSSVSIVSSVHVSNLPSGWIEKVHPATRQKFYIHELTGEKRWTMPTNELDKSDIPSSSQSANSITTSQKRKDADYSVASQSTDKSKKAKQSFDVDPLDPTGGRVNH